MEQPRSTAVAERVLSPVLGKSFIVYGRKSVNEQGARA